MIERTEIAGPAYPAIRGVSGPEVERAADELLRTGERPTVEKVRARLGRGSPNTINPLLDAWWKRLGARLDAGPAALHRLPQSVAHVAESLWLQALEEGRHRAQLELRVEQRTVKQEKDSLEVRSHVLSLREGELEARLREREREMMTLQEQLRALTTLLRKEQASTAHQTMRVQELERELALLRQRRVRQKMHLPSRASRASGGGAATRKPATRQHGRKKASAKRPSSPRLRKR